MTAPNSSILSQKAFWLLLALLVLLLIPFLGLTGFHTKGEPREAVVALSMLQSGDWILPVSNGTDIPYKPPMFAWVIACFSWIGGSVTTFTSRLPSALALIIMTMTGYCLCRRYRGSREAMLMALITVTSFEVHRAATNCRVDMLLTMFIVVSVYRLFDSFQHRGSIFSPVTLLFLSGGVLTKGPVGAILPLGIIAVFMLLSGAGFWQTAGRCALMFMASLIIPGLWYYAAYMRGGQEFLDLAMEENFGRFLGKMSYESHTNPWYYNIGTIIAGMAPYTLLALMSCKVIWNMIKNSASNISFPAIFKRIRLADPWTVLMWTAFWVVFIFYCIPASKRSVYLLPLYPMLAYGTGRIIMVLWRRGVAILNIYSGIIGVLAAITPIVFLGLTFLYSPDTTGRTGRMIAGMQEYAHSAPVVVYITFVASVTAGLTMLRNLNHRNRTGLMLLTTLSIYWSFTAVYQPAALRSKSNTAVTESLKAYPELHSWC